MLASGMVLTEKIQRVKMITIKKQEAGSAMRELEFSIEDNELEINKAYKVYETTNTPFYSYMIEGSLGMSHPIPINEPLKTNVGVVKEIYKKTIRSAILVFDE